MKHGQTIKFPTDLVGKQSPLLYGVYGRDIKEIVDSEPGEKGARENENDFN